MNIEKIYNADEMNSPLVTICTELEKQGYNIKLEGLEIKSADLEQDLFNDLEKATNEFEIELIKESEPKQKFKLIITDYHKFNLQPVRLVS